MLLMVEAPVINYYYKNSGVSSLYSGVSSLDYTYCGFMDNKMTNKE